MNREEMAWSAGFFDGEGCFSYTSSGRFPIVRVAQAEREPLDRFLAAVGVGKIYGPYLQKHKDTWARKPQYAFQVTGFERVQAIAALLWFKLGTTKREQAKRVLVRALYCKKGHAKTARGDGCGACTAEYWKRRREARLNPSGQATLLR